MKTMITAVALSLALAVPAFAQDAKGPTSATPGTPAAAMKAPAASTTPLPATATIKAPAPAANTQATPAVGAPAATAVKPAIAPPGAMKAGGPDVKTDVKAPASVPTTAPAVMAPKAGEVPKSGGVKK